MSKFKPETVEKNINYIYVLQQESNLRLCDPGQCSDHKGTKVVDKSRRNFICIKGSEVVMPTNRLRVNR